MEWIKYHEAEKVFDLRTEHSTYQMQVREYDTLVHLYYGSPVGDALITDRIVCVDRGFSGNPYEAEKDKTFSLDTLPQEYTAYGNGDYRINGLETEQADGSDTANLKFESYEITKGKYSLKGLPAMFAKEDEAETLEIVLTDRASGLKAHLLYGVFPHLDVITRAVRLENTGTAPVTVKKAMSMEMDYALFGSFHIPVRRQLLALHRLTKFVVEADALCGADGHIPFFQHAVFPGILEQCRNIRSHKVFALAPADDQRAFPLDCKNSVRVIPEQHGQRIAAAHLGKRLPQCTQRVTRIAAVDQLYQHFGVRLTLEGIAFCGQALLEQAVIFNDAVVHNAHTRGRMRVAVHIAGLAMGSPAGVADAAEALCQLLRRQLFPQGGEPSFAFYHADAAVQRKRHTGGVVPAILQLFQTIQQHVLRTALTDITNNAAHTKHLHTDRSRAKRRSDIQSAS